jgi:hypothetical protein
MSYELFQARKLELDLQDLLTTPVKEDAFDQGSFIQSNKMA